MVAVFLDSFPGLVARLNNLIINKPFTKLDAYTDSIIVKKLLNTFWKLINKLCHVYHPFSHYFLSDEYSQKVYLHLDVWPQLHKPPFPLFKLASQLSKINKVQCVFEIPSPLNKFQVGSVARPSPHRSRRTYSLFYNLFVSPQSAIKTNQNESLRIQTGELSVNSSMFCIIIS